MNAKRPWIEMIMACLLLVCFYYLSRQAADVSVVLLQNVKPADETKRTEQTIKTIAVDAGHGGADPGMIGYEGIEEKGINLEIAHKLKKVLEKTGKYEVVMTRQDDSGLYDENTINKKVQDMQRRIAFLDKEAPVLTVSIHQNSYQDPGVKGPQVFYYEASLQGKILAEKVQESLNRKLEVERPRKIKANTTYYLLKRSKGVLVIVECGFLTNPDEASLLENDEYQQKISEAIAEGITEYIKNETE